MVGRSPRRRSSWTKHTSYATIEDEETVHIPAEISASTRAHIRCADRRLAANTKRLGHIQRKKLSELDSQRKMLEKSMLAYSEKMKDIVSVRDNEVFREIHTRNSRRNDMREKSPTGSVRSNFSLPAKLITKYHNERRSLKGFHQVKLHSPIVERSTECTPVPRSRSAPRRLNPLTEQLHEKSLKPTIYISNENKNVQDKVDTSTPEKNRTTKVSPRVASAVLPWQKSELSDSAYSSASDDLDRDNSDLTSETSKSSKENKTSQLILTVPVVHIRKCKRKNRKNKKRIIENTRDQTIPTSANLKSVKEMILHNKV